MKKAHSLLIEALGNDIPNLPLIEFLIGEGAELSLFLVASSSVDDNASLQYLLNNITIKPTLLGLQRFVNSKTWFCLECSKSFFYFLKTHSYLINDLETQFRRLMRVLQIDDVVDKLGYEEKSTIISLLSSFEELKNVLTFPK